MQKSVFFITSLAVGSLISLLYMSVTAMHVTGNVVGVSDWVAHGEITKGMLNGESAPPHFLYQYLLIGLHKLFDVDALHMSPVAALIMVFVTFVIAYRFLSSVGGHKILPWMAITATCFLLLAHPVALLFPYDRHMYFGYIASNVFHNPSILILKPIALAHFVLLSMYLIDSEKYPPTIGRVATLVFLTVLSIAAKPNYIIVLLPALFLLICFRFVYSREGFLDDLRMTVTGVFLPAVIFLLWQFNYFYIDGNKNEIRLGIFEVFEYLSDLWTLLPKLVLSILFPISVALVLKRDLLRRTDFQLAALMFFFSLIYSYFLVDTVAGQGAGSGNFWWSAQISSFILFFVCIRSYISYILTNGKEIGFESASVSKYVPVYVGVLHFIFGLAWYVGNVYPVFRNA